MQTINILTRTSSNPKQFQRFYNSYKRQDYDGSLNLIVIADDNSTIQYLKEYNITPYFIDRIKIYNLEKNYPNPKGVSYLPWNTYFNHIESELLPGYILYIDSDDVFIDDSAISRLIGKIGEIDEDTLYFFDMKMNNRLFPGQMQDDCKPVISTIGGSCMMFHTKYYKDAKWIPLRASDFYVMYNLWKNKIPNSKYIKTTLIEVIKAGLGRREDIV